MKFKNVFNTESQKRRRIAKQALAEISQLDAAHYPLAMIMDKTLTIDRQTGESWPEAFARTLGGLTLPQLRDYTAGMIETGLYRTPESDQKTPTARELLNYFRGAAVLLLECEREIAAGR